MLPQEPLDPHLCNSSPTALSRGSLTVSKNRHSHSDKSTRAAIVLSSWSRVPGIVIEKDVIEILEEKAHRLKPAAEGASQKDSIVVD